MVGDEVAAESVVERQGRGGGIDGRVGAQDSGGGVFVVPRAIDTASNCEPLFFCISLLAADGR